MRSKSAPPSKYFCRADEKRRGKLTGSQTEWRLERLVVAHFGCCGVAHCASSLAQLYTVRVQVMGALPALPTPRPGGRLRDLADTFRIDVEVDSNAVSDVTGPWPSGGGWSRFSRRHILTRQQNGGFGPSVSNPEKLLWEGRRGSGEITPGWSATRKLARNGLLRN